MLRVGERSLAVVVAGDGFGGHEKMLCAWLKEAGRQGLEFELYLKRVPGLEREFREQGIPGERLRLRERGSGWKPLDALFESLWLFRTLGARTPRHTAVLVSLGNICFSPWLILTAKALKFRVYSYIPYSDRLPSPRLPWLKDFLLARAVRRVDAWITLSQEQKERLRDLWGVACPVHVIPNQVCPPGAGGGPGLDFGACPEPDPRPWDPRVRVLFRGRFVAGHKGLDWLEGELRAAPERWQGRLAFTFQGRGEFGGRLGALSDRFPGDISLLPWSESADAYRDADVLLLSSRQEGLPLVALEAVYYGLPVVASDRSGLSGFLPPEAIFPFGDFGALCAAVEGLRDGERRLEAIRSARRAFAAYASPEAFSGAVRALVQELGAV